MNFYSCFVMALLPSKIASILSEYRFYLPSFSTVGISEIYLSVLLQQIYGHFCIKILNLLIIL